MAHQMTDLVNCDLSIAMTSQVDSVLGEHVHKPGLQEDLTFAYWRLSVGSSRFTPVITALILPKDEERVLHGNASFASSYLRRVLAAVPQGSGVAFIHGHHGPGWQAMNCDDIVAERDRIAGPVAGKTGLPLVGLTRGVDGAWSGRIWLRDAPREYEQRPAGTVRVVGSQLSITYHPTAPAVIPTHSQEATLSVWGKDAQEKLVRSRVGIVGLGSVGSLVSEALSRLGLVDLHSLLLQLNVAHAHILGSSAGGPIAIQFALDYPEMTESLILINTMSYCQEAERAVRQQELEQILVRQASYGDSAAATALEGR